MVIVTQLCNDTKTTELYTSNGGMLWYGHYISIKVLKKKTKAYQYLKYFSSKIINRFTNGSMRVCQEKTFLESTAKSLPVSA